MTNQPTASAIGQIYDVDEFSRDIAVQQINQLSWSIATKLTYQPWPYEYSTELYLTTCRPRTNIYDPLTVTDWHSAGLFGHVVPQQGIYLNPFGVLVQVTRTGERFVKQTGIITLPLTAQTNCRLAAIKQGLTALSAAIDGVELRI